MRHLIAVSAIRWRVCRGPEQPKCRGYASGITSIPATHMARPRNAVATYIYIHMLPGKRIRRGAEIAETINCQIRMTGEINSVSPRQRSRVESRRVPSSAPCSTPSMPISSAPATRATPPRLRHSTAISSSSVTFVFRQEDLSKRASEIERSQHRKRARLLSG